MLLLKILLFGVHLIVSLALIVLVISQTSRHEGLGSVGGGDTTSFRGRPGLEEQLQRWTAYLAGAFMVLSVLVFVAVERFNW